MAGGVTRNERGAKPGRSLLARTKFWAKARATPRIGDPAGAPRARAQARLSATRLIVMLAVIAMGVTMVCAGIGYTMAHQSDERRAFEQREALRGAIAEFHALFGANRDACVDGQYVGYAPRPTHYYR